MAVSTALDVSRPYSDIPYSGQEYNLWDAVVDNDSGIPRLDGVREFYSDLGVDGIFHYNLGVKDIPLLTEVFCYWRDYAEYLLIKKEHVETGEIEYYGLKCSKRGNDVYCARVKNRLSFLKSGEAKDFFNYDDLTVDNNIYTQLLWVTLTFDTKLCSLSDAWVEYSAYFNRWITNIRKKYGHVWYCVFPAIFPNKKGVGFGYPHCHILMFFEDCKFSVYPSCELNKKGVAVNVFRIHDKYELEANGKWHSFIDVKAVNSLSGAYRYALRYAHHSSFGESLECDTNNAVLWFFRKRAFTISGFFRERYHDLINSMHNSNSNFFQVDVFVGDFAYNMYIYTLVGVFCASKVFSCVDSKFEGDWYVDLSLAEADSLLNC